MSYTNMNNVKMVDKSLVDKILEQGQKLRNAMVGSILKNDPFNTDIIYNKHFNTPQASTSELDDFRMVDNLTSIDEKRIEAFIRGEYMTKNEEKLALDTLRLLSAPALCKTTEKSLSSTRLSSCRCYTCEMYNSNNLYCDLRRKNVAHNVSNTDSYPVNTATKDIRDKYGTENGNILKHADSLKVSISSLILNERGIQKVSLYEDKKVPYNLSQTYFLEYSVPDSLVSKITTSKSKVKSGLETNQVRLCSRRNNDMINFKQVMVHDIKNMDRLSLDECDLSFKISYRDSKQKTASVLGFARFNLGAFLYSKNLTCHRGLSVFLNENSPIVVGVLKVSLQLGCGRLYFGQEFVDAINSTRRNSVVLDSDDSASQLNNLKPVRDNVLDDDAKETYFKDGGSSRKEDLPKSNIKSIPETKRTDSTAKVDSLRAVRNIIQTANKQSSYFKQPSKRSLQESTNFKPISDSAFKHSKDFNQNRIEQISENEKQILFGFLYISEAQYLSDPITTYITCRPFCQDETSRSQLVTNNCHPIFNFCQLIPLVFEDDLLHLLRENYMVIEFWKRTETTDVVFGLTKVFLHQFYLAYRNPVILKYLAKNQLPVIGTDWWEPIYAINTEEVVGQVQILIALGTEQQITSLKNERGFANNIVRAKFSSATPLPINPSEKRDTKTSDKKVSIQEFNGTNGVVNHRLRNGDDNLTNATKAVPKYSFSRDLGSKEKRIRDQAVNTSIFPKTVKVQKSDVGTQSDIEMEKKIETQQPEKANPTQEMLGSFLNQLMTQRQRNIFVENSTNTDTVQPNIATVDQTLQEAQVNTNVELRKTTDLLDSLQKALSLDGVNNTVGNKKRSNTFKTSIAINSANHLPSRKKCKSKRSRNRSIKNEENVLPSCYVTFETVPGNMRITQVVPKSTAPVWNYKCDVELPADLLTNNQKRLIFKVWRKSTNAVLQPNMQTDTVLGFAAVDLTVLLVGFPNVQGWFNVVDFSGKNNGQINIHITPLEDLSRFTFQAECNCNMPLEDLQQEQSNPDPEVEPPDTLSRALKRKFTELDEITQRLRLRLSKVTREDSDASSDGAVDEFENDINTLCIEEDFNLINFEEEAKKFNISHNKDVGSSDSGGNSKVDLQGGLVKLDESDGSISPGDPAVSGEKKSSTSDMGDLNTGKGADVLKIDVDVGTEKELAVLDKQLLQGKQRIDTLLEKLSLLSADTNNPFASRYVSGCSINSDNNASAIDTEAILKELDHGSRPNIQSVSGFDPLVFQQLYGGSVYSNSKSSTVTTSQGSSSNSNSDTSLITNFSDCRPAPDGQGNVSDEKVGKTS